jgi:pyrroline-5-carboxylate reductase
MNSLSTGFIGGGRIVRVILTGWQNARIPLNNLVVSDNNLAVLESLKQLFPEITTTTDNHTSAAQKIVFIALHPPALRTALPELINSWQTGAIVISLAPVITFQELTNLIPDSTRLVRMIPNAPSMIGKGYNPVAFSPAIRPEERSILDPLFSALGEYPEVSEPDLEAYAILTAMAPTYFWFQWQTLRELGINFGLNAAEVDRALVTMLSGSIELLFNSGLEAQKVMDIVPIKPLTELEFTITDAFRQKLGTLYKKLKEASCEHLKQK